jgi:GT2 family glycosyltransferase
LDSLFGSRAGVRACLAMRIGAGILHYRDWPGVCVTIDALLAQTRKPDHLLVFDHASGDGSAGAIRASYPEIEVVEAPDNRGPAAGENRMMNELLSREFDAIFILPDDLEIAPDTLEHLAARLEEDQSIGVVGPLIAHKHDRDRIFYAGGYVRRHNWSLDFREVPSKLSEWKGQSPRAVDFLQTGGALMRARAVNQAGDNEEKFYYWADDVDYTLKLGALGWRVECVPAAVGWQEFGYPPPYIATRNRLLLIARNAPKRFVARELARQAYWLVRDAISPPDGTRNDLWPRLRGIVDFCRGRWGPPPESFWS